MFPIAEWHCVLVTLICSGSISGARSETKVNAERQSNEKQLCGPLYKDIETTNKLL